MVYRAGLSAVEERGYSVQMKRTIVAALAMLAFVNAARAEDPNFQAQRLGTYCAAEKNSQQLYICQLYIIAFLEGNELAFMSLPEKTPRPYCLPSTISPEVIAQLVVGQYKIAPTRDKIARMLLFRTLIQSFPCPS